MNPRTTTPAAPPSSAEYCRVSVIIKALNEEQRICATLESALKAVAAVGGEVILADSCSTDRTVELASQYPVRIVQLLNANERCCGIGPQLGFQHSQGEYVYILDGDMEMKPDFLPYALSFMSAHPEVAGVAGRVVEHNTHSLEYIARNENKTLEQSPQSVDRLDGGGLYRRACVEAVGYLSDRNLHSYEELDLAIRLRSQGLELWRLPVDAVSHFGHDMPPYQLLMRRWRSAYICGLGEILRAAVGHRRFGLALTSLRELRLYVSVMVWWILLVTVAFSPIPSAMRASITSAIFLMPLLVMTWRKKSVARGLYALVSWNFHAAGLLRGLLRPQRPARDVIASRIVREPASDSLSMALLKRAQQLPTSPQHPQKGNWKAELMHPGRFDVE
ncbi:MAG: glycosyltransferase [Polaromonas sp.]|nr:glycosyltransferase [Polaromonas sp.]